MKFSIRDVLWLTVVVALAVCWGIDRVRLQREASRALMLATHSRDAAVAAERDARMAAELARAQAEMVRAQAELARAAEQQNSAP
jgi:hypothetical protein